MTVLATIEVPPRPGRETRVRHGNDTATNTVVATAEVAVTRDWKHAYVTNDTTTNMVVVTVPVGDDPEGSPSPRIKQCVEQYDFADVLVGSR